MKITRVETFRANKRKLPTSLVPFFSISYFIFGFDFGFAAHLDEKYRSIAKYVSLGISFLMMIILITPLKSMYSIIWVWFTVWEYFLYFLILKTTKYSPCDLILDLKSPKDDLTTLGVLVIAYTFIMMILKLIVGFSRCFDSKYSRIAFCKYLSYVFYFFYYWPSLSVDLMSVVLVIVFYYISLKLWQLKMRLENSEINLNLFLQQYMYVADCYDKIKPFLNNIFLTLLTNGVPKLLTALWYTLWRLKQTGFGWSSYAADIIFTAHVILQICLPAFVAESINSQIEAIKLVLSEKIAKGTEDAEASNILQYLQHRRLRHEIFRVVPLDIRLPIALFGFCSTYFIVILQFTHLYD